MSKKAGRKLDLSYHDDYYVDDGILDGDPDDTEYTDWCNQCGHQRPGYIDPSSNIFYCNPCWTAFSSPQQTQKQTPASPPQQQQQQPQQSQSTSTNKKTRRGSKKNQNKKQQPKQTKQSQKAPPPQPQPTNNHKSADIANRPSIFDTFSNNNNSDNTANAATSFLDRPSLFGDANDTHFDTKKPYKKDENVYVANESNEEELELKIEPNPYISTTVKKAHKPKKKKKKKTQSDSNIIHRQFIGCRIESEQTYKRREIQKEELLKSRFGLTDLADIDLGVDHDKDGDKKAKKKKKKKHFSEAKPHINLVVIGHVDAGKSTLMGRLLYEYGIVTNKTMHKYKHQSAESGKSSFAFAWVLDCHQEERKRGITVDVSTHYFETPHRCITLLDSPGHKDFIPNMISGASQADAAILVINSKKGDFETGFDVNNGQTREHALIAKSLGVQQIIVAVNKMDCCGWDKRRFEMIVVQIKAFLKEIGFANKKKKRNVIFIPVSGLTGANLMSCDVQIVDAEKDNDVIKWWKKQDEHDTYLTNLSLFEVIDSLRSSSSIFGDSLSGKLRMSITDIYKELNVGIVVSGKIVSGCVINFQQILLQPLNLVTKIKNLISIENHSQKYKHAIAIKGDNIQLLLDIHRDSNDEIFDQIKVGDIITSPHEPLKLINKFVCKIVTMKNLKIPICKGHHIIIHTQSVEKEAYISKIDNILNKKSGQIENRMKHKHIRHIKADQCAIVTVKLKNKNDIILLDTYQNLKELSRITIRRDGQTIALGLVQTV